MKPLLLYCADVMLQPVLRKNLSYWPCNSAGMKKGSLASLLHLSAGSLETELRDFIFQETHIDHTSETTSDKSINQ